ncbi:hypothetical protein J6590_014480 [Homalodisca vitripennis]|nr:hypothetical protein J6590_014480 [Homalodisca vitripennis]
MKEQAPCHTTKPTAELFLNGAIAVPSYVAVPYPDTSFLSLTTHPTLLPRITLIILSPKLGCLSVASMAHMSLFSNPCRKAITDSQNSKSLLNLPPDLTRYNRQLRLLAAPVAVASNSYKLFSAQLLSLTDYRESLL